VLKNDEQIRDTRCGHTKAKDRAKTLPFRRFAKSNKLCLFMT